MLDPVDGGLLHSYLLGKHTLGHAALLAERGNGRAEHHERHLTFPCMTVFRVLQPPLFAVRPKTINGIPRIQIIKAPSGSDVNTFVIAVE